jgi:hypothetical protein
MSNGKIDEAEVQAILSGGRSEVDAYLVRAVHELTRAVEDMPDMLAEAIAEHRADCRGHSRKQVIGLASAVSAAIGLATPFIIRLCF